MDILPLGAVEPCQETRAMRLRFSNAERAACKAAAPNPEPKPGIMEPALIRHSPSIALQEISTDPQYLKSLHIVKSEPLFRQVSLLALIGGSSPPWCSLVTLVDPT